MKLDELKTLMQSGQFHHATYRNFGTLWEGLYIYRKYDGLRGFEPCGAFPKDDPELDAAHDLLRGTGVSVGAYGNG
jgi:hypothetical protein